MVRKILQTKYRGQIDDSDQYTIYIEAFKMKATLKVYFTPLTSSCSAQDHFLCKKLFYVVPYMNSVSLPHVSCAVYIIQLAGYLGSLHMCDSYCVLHRSYHFKGNVWC